VSDDRPAVPRIFRLLADRLEQYLDGDELAFETLGERLDEAGIGAEELQEAVFALRSMAGDLPVEETTHLGQPGAGAQRVLSAEERGALSPEAWGTLLGLRRHGSLSVRQFERVLEMLGGSGVRPIGVDLVLEIATRVALMGEREDIEAETSGGEFDLAN